MRLLCLKCKKGSLDWVDELPDEVEELGTAEMLCNHCSYIYKGFEEYCPAPTGEQ